MANRLLWKSKIFTQPQVKRIRRGLEITSFQVTDATGIANVDTFNQIYIKNNITVGQVLYLYGKLEYKFGKMVISAPELYFKKPESPFLPIYPLTAGLNQNMMRRFGKEAYIKPACRNCIRPAFCMNSIFQISSRRCVTYIFLRIYRQPLWHAHVSCLTNCLFLTA